MEKEIKTSRMQKMEYAKTVKDEDKLYKFEGVLYSSIMSPPENLKALKNMEARPEDSLLVAYPKCGFNWMIIVIFKIMAATTGPKELPNVPQMLEFFSPDYQQLVKEKPSPRLLGTHLHPDKIPASFIEKKAKMLVVFRNPKDTVVSYYHFMNKNPVLPNTKSWDAFFTDFMKGEVAWGSYFDHAQAWEKRIDDSNVMIVTFEQLKENLVERVLEISTFFGFPLTDEQVQIIARETTFSAMKESSEKTHGQHGGVFFRKGEVGDWKNHFSEAQSKQMDEEFQKRLAGTKLGAMLNYDVYCT